MDPALLDIQVSLYNPSYNPLMLSESTGVERFHSHVQKRKIYDLASTEDNFAQADNMHHESQKANYQTYNIKSVAWSLMLLVGL